MSKMIQILSSDKTEAKPQTQSFMSCWSFCMASPNANHLISISAGPTLNNKGTPLNAEISRISASLEVTPGAQTKVRSLSVRPNFLLCTVVWQ